ncbi:hypothetical protein M758_UG080700 [Ceratodon purpureus]|nr:hypothetical protein M758_UG080700 [Ceratodon purpureus]
MVAGSFHSLLLALDHEAGFMLGSASHEPLRVALPQKLGVARLDGVVFGCQLQGLHVQLLGPVCVSELTPCPHCHLIQHLRIAPCSLQCRLEGGHPLTLPHVHILFSVLGLQVCCLQVPVAPSPLAVIHPALLIHFSGHVHRCLNTYNREHPRLVHNRATLFSAQPLRPPAHGRRLKAATQHSVRLINAPPLHLPLKHPIRGGQLPNGRQHRRLAPKLGPFTGARNRQPSSACPPRQHLVRGLPRRLYPTPYNKRTRHSTGDHSPRTDSPRRHRHSNSTFKSQTLQIQLLPNSSQISNYFTNIEPLSHQLTRLRSISNKKRCSVMNTTQLDNSICSPRGPRRVQLRSGFRTSSSAT